MLFKMLIFWYVLLWLVPSQKRVMDPPSQRKYLEDEETSTMKIIKGTTMGLVTGTIWGTIVASWHDVPRVEKHVALPGLIRTVKMMGSYGATFAAVGGVYIAVEQLMQNYRMKKDLFNGAVGGFVAGATIFGYKGRILLTIFELFMYFSYCCHIYKEQ